MVKIEPPPPGPIIPPLPFLAPQILASLYSAAVLEIARDKVETVLTTVKNEHAVLLNSTLDIDADVPEGRFGQGAEARALEIHHAKAHGVAVDTVAKVVGDLETFYVSIDKAIQLIDDADAAAATQATALVGRVEANDYGTQARQEAQVAHANDRPDEEGI